MYNILVCDDDREIVDAIEIYLTQEGYHVLKAYDGMQAIQMLEREEIQLLIIDVMMPKLDGIRATLKIREKSSIPIIILSAKSEDVDKILGLNIGADDYVTKPFSPSELVARVDAVYRRVAQFTRAAEPNFSEELRSGRFVLNLRNRSFTKDGNPVELTQVEFQIMEYFISNAGKALKRSEILKHVWGSGYVGEEKIVDVNIRRLRMKIEDEPSNPRHVVTVWGIGYRWDK